MGVLSSAIDSGGIPIHPRPFGPRPTAGPDPYLPFAERRWTTDSEGMVVCEIMDSVVTPAVTSASTPETNVISYANGVGAPT